MSNPTTVYIPDANLVKTIRRMIHGPGIEANDEDAVVISKWHKDQIKELEDKVTKLEMQNDHLEEGCNERDKELVDLREQYSNVCQTVADLQVMYGNAVAELNKLKGAK